MAAAGPEGEDSYGVCEKEDGMDESKENVFGSRRLTLKDLKAERHSLNRQILLAIQLHDSVAQEKLERQAEELQEKISRFSAREYHWGED